MTSAELEAAVRAHRERTKTLLKEIRARRAAEKNQEAITVMVRDIGSSLQVNFSNGAVENYDDVDALIESLYKLGIQPEQVTALDWHEDIDQAPSSGTKIALFSGLRKRYQDS